MSFLPLVVFAGGVSTLLGHFWQMPVLFWIGLAICGFSFVMDRIVGGPIPFIEIGAIVAAKILGLDLIHAVGVGLAVVCVVGDGIASIGLLARRQA